MTPATAAESPEIVKPEPQLDWHVHEHRAKEHCLQWKRRTGQETAHAALIFASRLEIRAAFQEITRPRLPVV